MASFLDRQTVHHKIVDTLVNTSKTYKPDKYEFIGYVSTILGEEVFDTELLNDYFKTIRPEFERDVLKEKTKECAFEYANYIKFLKNRNVRFQKKNCHPKSIDLPEINYYEELGGRLIK